MIRKIGVVGWSVYASRAYLERTGFVRAGIGLSVLPCFVAHADPALVRLTPAVVAQVKAFLVIPPDHRNTVRVHLLMDAVAALFERERAPLVLSGCV